MNVHFNHKKPVESKTAEQIALELRQEERLEALLQEATGNATPSEKLQRCVAAMAAQHEEKEVRRQSRARVIKRGFALCTAATFAFIAVRATPFVMAELFLRRVEAAVDKVQSAHVVTWKIEDGGKRQRVVETWQQAGLFRSESWPEEATGRRREIQLFRDGKLWTYEPQRNKVTLRRQNTPYGARGVDLTGTGLIRAFTKASVLKSSMSVTTEHTTANGQPARRVRIKTTGSYESYDTRVLVDDNTDLPISVQMEVLQEQTGKKLTMVSEFDFNRPLSAGFFKPDFPRTARIFDYDNGKEEWRKRLQTGIASRKVGDRTIVIRDLQVNDEGDVFMLYSAGRKFIGDEYTEWDKKGLMDSRDWRIKVKDEFGTEYVESRYSFYPTVESIGNFNSNVRLLPNGFIYNGEKLEGAWWIPLHPQKPWKPRRFTITFQVSPINQQGLERSKAEDSEYSARAVFTVPVQGPETALVPEYATYMNMAPWRDEDILDARAEARGLLPPGVEESPELVQTLNAGDSVQSLAFAEDGRTLASAAEKSGIKLWDVKTGKLRRTLSGEVNGLIYEPNGDALVSTSHTWDNNKKQYTGNSVQFWDAESGSPTWKLSLASKNAAPLDVNFAQDGSTVTAAGTIADEGRLEHGVMTVSKMSVQARVWDNKSGKVLHTITIPHEAFVYSVALTPDGKMITTTSNSKGGINNGSIVRVWDVQSGKQLKTLAAPERFDTLVLSVSQDGRTLAGGGTRYDQDSTRNVNQGVGVHIWDLSSGELLQSMKGGSGWLRSLAFSPDGRRLASADDDDKTVEVWDVASGRQLHSFVGHGRGIRKVAFSPDGGLLASGDSAGVIKLWKVK